MRRAAAAAAETLRVESAALAERRRFAEEHLVTKTGSPFRLPPERQWVLDEYWGAADGFNLWPVDVKALCDECRVEAGTLVYDWVPAHRSQRAPHLATGCKGLELQPIVVTVINLPRQEGKTTNGMGYDLSTVFKQRNKYITFVAAAEAQTHRLFEENYRHAIDANPKLKRRCTIVGSKLFVPSTNSQFSMVSTSASSSVGSSPTHVRYDEARDIPSSVFMALVPSIFARNGVECPIPGHFHVEGFNAKRKTCPKCGTRLVPWYGRLIITSSSGVSEGNGDNDWFAELVEHLTDHPDPNFHLYKRDESMNPAVSGVVKGAIDRVFGVLGSTRDYVEAEVHNRARKKGEDFVAKAQLERVLDETLVNLEGSSRLGVGFLDTSISGDMTSLVLSLDDAEEMEPDWHRLVTGHVKIWDPSKARSGVIDEFEVEQYLCDYIPLFTGLRVLVIDDHMMPWAIRMLKRLRAKPWGKLLASANSWKGTESEIGWNLLEERILAERIRIHDLEQIRREFAGVRKRRRPDNTVVVEDRNRKKMHRDVTEAIACTCYLAHLESMRSRMGLAQTEAKRSKDLISRLPRPVVRLRPEDL